MKPTLLILVLIFGVCQTALASSNQSDKIMAKILIHLNHYPSSTEKNQLSNIIKHANSDHEKIVANAILNLHHSASSSDKKQLKNVMNDSSAPENLKNIARIVYHLNHKPTGSDKQTLAAILD